MSGRCREGFALALVLGLALGGCTSVSDEGDDAGAVTEAVYAGRTQPADISAANANAIGAMALHMAGDLEHLAGLLSQNTPGISGASARPLLSVTTACEQGGSRTLTSNAGEKTAEFLNCRDGGVTVDGTARRNGGDDAWTLSIAGVRMVADDFDLSIAGSASYRDEAGRETLTLHDVVVSDNRNARSLLAENLLLIRSAVTNGELLSIDGALLHSEHGLVDIDTDDNDPLFIASGDRYPSAGLLTLTGLGNESLILMPLSSSQVNIRVDTDGVGGVDLDETLNWQEFATRA